ncbi:tetratricopeptide repeat protein [Arsukibacterium sp. UBA3155]|uniref:tetratricopeptide repeat protein n=1 Tax=Arsukibacterium sp. UBA3155 TaxID=1946058 RepID=UPI0025BBBCA2|nr:tetratricopeptide repeat protein [Arsukibacterium sp. UBA3155]|tara:strand:+ start:11569 stop:13446 length:1878 start_codon:yes stop_codon:yes gene_type:complete
MRQNLLPPKTSGTVMVILPFIPNIMPTTLASAATVTRRSNVLFYSIALAIPLLLILAAELLLRQSSLYQRYPLTVPVATMPGYLQANPALINRYFATPELAPQVSPDTQYFLSDKPAGLQRIIFIGGSSAAGFPYGRWGAPAAMLQQRLKRLYPEQHIEVINLAMAAINSYTLLDISDEVIALKPDLVLVYAGHNEFLGVLGVGSAFAGEYSHGTKLLYLTLRKLALFQALQRLSAWLSAPPAFTAERTMMAQIARHTEIAKDSALFNAGINQFSANMRLLLSQYQTAGIPVLLSTIASNEADQPPFVSAKPAHPDPTIQQLQQALITEPHIASWHFQLAGLYRQQGDTQQALIHYQLAREHDLLRFRAPQAINATLARLSSDFKLPLVDGEAMLRQQSADSIIGKPLMLEHLHPNQLGYFWLAEAFLPAVQQQLGLNTTDNIVTPSQALADMPLTEVDLALAQFKVRQLTADYPFVSSRQPVNFAPSSNPFIALARERSNGLSWLEASQRLVTLYQQQGRISDAAKVAALLSDALPTESHMAFVAGQLYFDSQQFALAGYYQRKAVTSAPDNINYRLMLARTYYYQQQLARALTEVEHILRREPGHPVAQRQQQQLRQQLTAGD